MAEALSVLANPGPHDLSMMARLASFLWHCRRCPGDQRVDLGLLRTIWQNTATGKFNLGRLATVDQDGGNGFSRIYLFQRGAALASKSKNILRPFGQAPFSQASAFGAVPRWQHHN
jgi:hypothetical protein